MGFWWHKLNGWATSARLVAGGTWQVSERFAAALRERVILVKGILEGTRQDLGFGPYRSILIQKVWPARQILQIDFAPGATGFPGENARANTKMYCG